MVITKEIIAGFEKYLLNEERSVNTAKKYLRDIRAFHAHIGGKSIEKSDVLDYKRLLCEKYAPKSVNSILSSLNALFVFSGKYELRVKTLKIQRKIFADKEKELTKAEYFRLLKTAVNRCDERLYCLMQTVAGTGVRVSEIKHITVEAVRNGLATINCKGKIRQIFLPKKLCQTLKSYAKKLGIKSGSVFVTRNGKPLDRHTIWKMLKSLCVESGVAKIKVFPHFRTRISSFSIYCFGLKAFRFCL